MYTESNVKLSCNALWQKCVLATLYRAAATHPEIKLLQFKLIVWVHHILQFLFSFKIYSTGVISASA
ncbi:hypothetical protein, partial [Escherichia coli]|uniref:hypothetical protein n=1 Tax=Escherichia coli TaxID=562 RepID=UPI001A7E1833